MIGELAAPHSYSGRSYGAGVQHPEILLPDRCAVHVECEQPLRSEERDDIPPVGGGRGVGVGRLDVTLLAGDAVIRGPLPDRPAGLAIERDHDPLLRRAILGGGAFAVESGLEGRVGAAADRGGQEQPIVPDDRARVGEARHCHFPCDVPAGGAVPVRRQPLAIGNARGRWSAKAGPARHSRCPESRGGAGLTGQRSDRDNDRGNAHEKHAISGFQKERAAQYSAEVTAAGFQLPATSYQLRVSDRRSPIADRRSPIADADSRCRAPSAERRAPSVERPAPSAERPAPSAQRRASGASGTRHVNTRPPVPSSASGG